jgi:hypothetical protein
MAAAELLLAGDGAYGGQSANWRPGGATRAPAAVLPRKQAAPPLSKSASCEVRVATIACSESSTRRELIVRLAEEIRAILS